MGQDTVRSPTLAQVSPRRGGRCVVTQARPAYPHPDDVDLHEQQHPVEDDQQPRKAEPQLREADVVVIELDKLDGLGDEGQGPVDEQGCGGEQTALRGCVHTLMCVQVCRGVRVNKHVLQRRVCTLLNKGTCMCKYMSV